jgi:DNA polymerase III subunit delta'
MAEETDDPREVPWHPRFAPQLVGHEKTRLEFRAAFASGRPHHAWLIHGPEGIGKATFAYAAARDVLSQTMDAKQVERWVHGRAHPDMVVLQRALNDAKPTKKLRAEIAVDDVRKFIDFFGRTATGGGWRVGLVDTADDLNAESANALLKLVEEPPSKTLILLISNQPGQLLRTLRSRCRRLSLTALTEQQSQAVLKALPLEPAPDSKLLIEADAIAQGRPGFALQILNSEGAKAFHKFTATKRLDAPARAVIGQHFATRASAQHDFEVFMGLLLAWIAGRAKQNSQNSLSALHSELTRQQGIVTGYNLDRRSAVMDALSQIDHALKVA